MEYQNKINKNISELLTNERFKFRYSEVKKELEVLKSNDLINNKQFEKIYNEDILLKIKYKTYKKALRNLIIGLVLIGTGFVLMNTLPFRYLIIVGGIILSVSSFFGIQSNKLTKSQKEYLKS
ncbi:MULTISPECIES: hypothetical protein [Tenacibaculum]|uniref:hypothetical protein n=1 Tax=Tenacibaculum TaxID=104267 RepID=UPI00142FF58B|nr:hypothetical protein [Tenacibaculum mesophilum]KAF9657624.1 hypothetical protein HBA12_10305 [Tenacibaculum mesophilum]